MLEIIIIITKIPISGLNIETITKSTPPAAIKTKNGVISKKNSKLQILKLYRIETGEFLEKQLKD